MGLQMGEVAPVSFSDRARKLGDATWGSRKRLLDEIRFYRDYSSALASYAAAIHAAWRGKRRSWPKRPLLPSLKGSK